MTKHSAEQEVLFSVDDWDEELRDRARLARPEKVIYCDQELALCPPPGPIKTAAECVVLMVLKAERARWATQIYREAQGADQAAASVLAAVGLSTDSPVSLPLKDARAFIVSQLSGPIDEFKRKFMRARPWTTCPDALEPMLLRPHWRYPGQPAYPSGHATVAWTFAYLFGALSPKGRFKPHFEHAAARVARNREIAGVHYPSDSEAGRQLAAQMAKFNLANPAFQAHGDLIQKLLYSPGYESKTAP